MKTSFLSLACLVAVSAAGQAAPEAERAPRVPIAGPMTIFTEEARWTLRGSVAGASDWLFHTVGCKPWRTEPIWRGGPGRRGWKITCARRPGRNVISVTASYRDARGRDRYTRYRHVEIFRTLRTPEPTPTPTRTPDHEENESTAP